MVDPLDELQEWYHSQCDGDWERDNGVMIDTLENPGWRLRINLLGTSLDGMVFEEKQNNYDDPAEWYICRTEDNCFVAAGGPRMLSAMINEFIHWSRGD